MTDLAKIVEFKSSESPTGKQRAFFKVQSLDDMNKSSNDIVEKPISIFTPLRDRPAVAEPKVEMVFD